MHLHRTAAVLLLAFSGLVAVAAADEPAQPRKRRPPPEAIKACEALAPGDACTVELPDRKIDGTCREAPDGEGPLACVPKHAPPPPPADDR